MDEIIISADSHVIEVPDLWEKGVPQPLKERVPKLYFDDKRDAWMFGSPNEPLTIDKPPSEYFRRQVYATFFNDHVGGRLFSWWGADNCMWSNDYPHQNSTWPNSREVIRRDLGNLPAADRKKLLCANVEKLYNLKLPTARAA